jgi:hypothetical protein
MRIVKDGLTETPFDSDDSPYVSYYVIQRLIFHGLGGSSISQKIQNPLKDVFKENKLVLIKQGHLF